MKKTISENENFSLYFANPKTKSHLLKIAVTALARYSPSPDLVLNALGAISRLFEFDLSAAKPNLKSALLKAVNNSILSESVPVVNAVLKRFSLILAQAARQWPETAVSDFSELFGSLLKTPKKIFFKMNYELVKNFVSAFTTSVLIINDFSMEFFLILFYSVFLDFLSFLKIFFSIFYVFFSIFKIFYY